MATCIPVAADLAQANPAPPSGASKPGDGVQISTVEIKPQAKATVKPENITNPTLSIPNTLPQSTAQSTGKNAVSTAPNNTNIPPGYKLIQKPLGNGKFFLVLRKMTPEELTAAGPTVDTNTAPKPATSASPPVTPVTSSCSVTASVPAIPDKPDLPVAKSESTSPATSRSANISAGATAIMGGLVMATENFAKMAEHGMKIHSSLTGQPLPSTPNATAATPAPAAAAKPAETAPVAGLPIQSRMVVPGTADANTLAIAPTAAAGLAALPTIFQAPLTQVAVPSMGGQPASVLSYYTNSAPANTANAIQPAASSNAAHADGSSSNDVHPDAHDSDHARGPGDNAGQQQDDTIFHDHQNDQSSPQDQDEDDHHGPQEGDHYHEPQDEENTHDHQDGDIPYEPQDGDVPYDPQEGDIPYEPEEGDIPYDPQDGDIPFESEDGDIPYDPQEGDIPYEPQEGDIPYEDQDDTPLEHEDEAAPDEDISHDQGEDINSGGNDGEEYDVDDEPQDDDDFDHGQVDDDPY